MAPEHPPLRGQRPVTPAQRRRIFANIYSSNRWAGEGTRAGPGSSPEATAQLRGWLPETLERYGIRSVLDAGCSDATWMPDLPGYLGVDIVVEAIEEAKLRHPHRAYRVADIVEDPLPFTDAVICRDALQHLGLVEGLQAVANFRRSATWLLANSHREGHNRGIVTGSWYPIDLEAEPFNLGPPLEELPDGSWASGLVYPTKFFGLWRLKGDA